MPCANNACGPTASTEAFDGALHLLGDSSIGFIGTVRGIGDALGQAYKAVEGDISGVTASLGVAFNSTFVALVLSIIIMFALHQLQLSQERLVLNTQRYIDRHLLRHLSVPRG